MSYMFKRSYTSLRRHVRSIRNAPPALFTHPQGYSEVVAGTFPSKPGNLFRSAMSTLWTDLSNPYESRQSYWQCLERWKDIEEESFLSYQWQIANTIDRKDKLIRFVSQAVPDEFPAQSDSKDPYPNGTKTRVEFVEDVEEGIKAAPMSIRLTPHILSVIDWSDPYGDPVRRQFIPVKSSLLPDHHSLSLDSLHERHDSPVEGLVHRYPDKVLFLATSVCPVYCRFCTRSYAVGSNTESVSKASTRPTLRRWNAMFDYIERAPHIQDVVISGGDAYYLGPEHIRLIGDRLLNMANIKRIRFATKGLAVNPARIIDSDDGWTRTFVDVSKWGRAMGKQVAIHTHFNHPKEITWVTVLAARHLFNEGVIVRNQSVLLKGVNDDVGTMSKLIRRLADLNIEPYYVYQGDMVQGVEDLRTPLSTILELEKQIRGTIAGFMTPSFVVDLPGGGGKRLANSYDTYDPTTGVSTWRAPGVAGDNVYEYHDPRSWDSKHGTKIDTTTEA